VKTSDFDYYLPQELIAQSPIEPRDASRLMVLDRKSGAIAHRTFHDLADYVAAGDVLICNESRVVPARLFGRKVPTGGKVELLLVAKRGERTWEVLTRGQAGDGIRLMEFQAPIEPLLDDLGVVPLPPYIHEPLKEPERYQTIYARVKGSVAAPTAGLHFTPQLMKELEAKGVEFAFVTLHIGLDTFRPVRTDNIEDHLMHSEYCQLSPEVARQVNQAKADGRRIIAVGTTSMRVLETAVGIGKLVNWETGKLVDWEIGKLGTGQPTTNLPIYQSTNLLTPFSGWTDLFIYPGYQFRVVDALITNFHLPRSTLLMLVAAFAGKELIDRAYREAIQQEYRFYSFGDAMLIL
jgi:S-adenosylmethionine:tRNA ribosyltransferase-isomerase